MIAIKNTFDLNLFDQDYYLIICIKDVLCVSYSHLNSFVVIDMNLTDSKGNVILYDALELQEYKEKLLVKTKGDPNDKKNATIAKGNLKSFTLKKSTVNMDFN